MASFGFHGACSSAVAPRDGLRITILDGGSVRVDGQTMGFEEFDRYARAKVQDAKDRGVVKPVAYVDAYSTVPGHVTSRVVDVLANAGVRSVELLPIIH
ncbi:MAG: hypothetical protein KDC95_20705 [Planctomycetes bacterium]|nr:hypothetical protein [Planctomycetota bacterium]